MNKPEISIVAGDYLYAKAFMLLAGLGDPWISQAFSACAHEICEGEMKQIEKRKSFLMSEDQYLKIIHQKTAALFQAACMGGAYLSGAGPESIKNLGGYGFNLGMAFQIVDDCLDLVGETESLGKTACSNASPHGTFTVNSTATYASRESVSHRNTRT